MKRRLGSKISDFLRLGEHRIYAILRYCNPIESNSFDNSNGRKFLLPFDANLNQDTQCNCQSCSSWQFTDTMQDFSDVKTELGTLYPTAEK